MAATRFLGLASLVSLACSQRTLDLPSFCGLPPVVATASVLAQYGPALSFCSKNFPGATNPITLIQSAGPEFINVVTSTIGVTTDAFTTTTLLATAVVTITPSTIATETVTVSATDAAFTTDLSPILPEKRAKGLRKHYGPQHGDSYGYRGSGRHGRLGGYQLRPGHGGGYAVNAPPQYGQSTLDTVITATPSPTSAFDPEDVFESLQLLPSTLIGPVCTCIEAPEVVVAISALPVGENTEWIMETVTVFTTAVPQLVATVSVATTETFTAVGATTTVTVTIPTPSVT
ncbi:hypothetical protein E8E14_012268 [Neopestalotiopsis sp. 37M]|nr:hypothetical protein E8E14_012268 [Neopestalotiopsis sp. 37M]